MINIVHLSFNFPLVSTELREYYSGRRWCAKTVCHEDKSCIPLVRALQLDKEDLTCHHSLVAVVTAWPFELLQTVLKRK